MIKSKYIEMCIVIDMVVYSPKMTMEEETNKNPRKNGQNRNENKVFIFFSDSVEKEKNLILCELDLDTVAKTQFNWQTKTHFTQNTKNERKKTPVKLKEIKINLKRILYYCSNNFTYTHRTHHTNDTMQFRCCTEEEDEKETHACECVWLFLVSREKKRSEQWHTIEFSTSER